MACGRMAASRPSSSIAGSAGACLWLGPERLSLEPPVSFSSSRWATEIRGAGAWSEARLSEAGSSIERSTCASATAHRFHNRHRSRWRYCKGRGFSRTNVLCGQDLADLLETLATFSEPMRPRAGVIDVRLSTPSMPSEPGKPSGTQRVIRDTATLGRVVHAFDLATDFWEYQSPGASQQLKRHALALETPSSSSSSVTASPPGLATSSAPGFASQTAREALEEARTWAQTAEQERSELAERLERTLQRASMAESTAGRLQSDLSVARDPAEIIRLERVLDTAREEAETPRQEVRGLERRDHPPGRQRHAGRSGPHPAGCLRARVGPGDFLHRP